MFVRINDHPDEIFVVVTSNRKYTAITRAILKVLKSLPPTELKKNSFKFEIDILRDRPIDRGGRGETPTEVIIE